MCVSISEHHRFGCVSFFVSHLTHISCVSINPRSGCQECRMNRSVWSRPLSATVLLEFSSSSVFCKILRRGSGRVLECVCPHLWLKGPSHSQGGLSLVGFPGLEGKERGDKKGTEKLSLYCTLVSMDLYTYEGCSHNPPLNTHLWAYLSAPQSSFLKAAGGPAADEPLNNPPGQAWNSFFHQRVCLFPLLSNIPLSAPLFRISNKNSCL